MAERKRFCPACDNPVGRATATHPDGRLYGFCSACGARFDFRVKVAPGELVAGQYRVAGALAHGGLGWVYLAQDTAVADRWVVLKGLLNSEDAAAARAAAVEKAFLAALDHPDIVKVYNFATHGSDSYIVMEYVGGPSITQLIKENGRPLPVDHAIALILAALPAFGYLHQQRLVYCDFKPDNLIRVGDAVKLIDLGGARRLDDPDGDIYGTVGFQAEEIAALGPSVASDLYTIGRTLAVMCLDFRGYNNAYRFSLPEPDHHGVLVDHPSLWRWLQRACAPHPDDRFQSAVEMADQLYGVLCHVVAELTGLPHPRPSTMFEAPGVSTVYLPELASDGADSARHMLVSFPTVAASTADAERLIVELATAAGIQCSMGVRLRRLRYGIDAWAGNPEKLEGELREVEDIDPWEWRVDWLRALDAVRRGDYDRALTAFERARSEAPGELAPMAAIGGVLELAGRYDEAGEMYRAVVDVDPGFVYAVFGLANCYEQVGDHSGAVAAYLLTPTSHLVRTEAVVRAAELLAINGLAQDCADQLASVRPAPVIAAKLHVLSYLGALEALAAGAAPPQLPIGAAATPVSLRRGLEAAYRQLARLTVDSVDKLWLVDCANQARPWTIA